ncbi:MAG: hypothetical protein ACO1SX_10435 [Actinomycetota bacterium]
MGTVLVSFLGAARRLQETNDPSNLGYRTACYRFPAEGEHGEVEVTTPLFGAALLQRLRSLGRSPDCWLVLGTDQSMWDALADAVPPNRRDRLPIDLLTAVSRAFRIEGASPPEAPDSLLSQWAAELEAQLGTPCVTARIGTGLTDQSWEALWSALCSVCGRKRTPGTQGAEAGRVDLVLDVTNGLRHHPVVAAFMVMLLRRLYRVGRVDLCYGALDLRDERGVAPVLFLPISTRMLEATEALATLQQTGNFAPLADSVALSPATRADIETVAFKDETGQEARMEALAAAAILDKVELDPIDTELAPWLREPLRWVAGQNLARRLGERARLAFEHEQYLKAVVLLYEAFAVAGVQRSADLTDEMSFRDREAAIQQLFRDDALLRRSEQGMLRDLAALRNAIVHGTPPGHRRRAGDALRWPQPPANPLTPRSPPGDLADVFFRAYGMLQQKLKQWSL